MKLALVVFLVFVGNSFAQEVITKGSKDLKSCSGSSNADKVIGSNPSVQRQKWYAGSQCPSGTKPATGCIGDKEAGDPCDFIGTGAVCCRPKAETK
jgi:hypothetical protein